MSPAGRTPLLEYGEPGTELTREQTCLFGAREECGGDVSAPGIDEPGRPLQNRLPVPARELGAGSRRGQTAELLGADRNDGDPGNLQTGRDTLDDPSYLQFTPSRHALTRTVPLVFQRGIGQACIATLHEARDNHLSALDGEPALGEELDARG